METYTVNYRDKTILLDDDIYYHRDGRVFVIQGLRYPVKVPLTADEPYPCPVCGHHIKADKRKCAWCKATFEV